MAGSSAAREKIAGLKMTVAGFGKCAERPALEALYSISCRLTGPCPPIVIVAVFFYGNLRDRADAHPACVHPWFPTTVKSVAKVRLIGYGAR